MGQTQRTGEREVQTHLVEGVGPEPEMQTQGDALLPLQHPHLAMELEALGLRAPLWIEGSWVTGESTWRPPRCQL